MLSKKILQKFFSNQDGATAVEYVLIVAGIAVVIVGGISAFGGELLGFIEGLGDSLGLGGTASGG
jgi:pilus assembly protein Flp/PilA